MEVPLDCPCAFTRREWWTEADLATDFTGLLPKAEAEVAGSNERPEAGGLLQIRITAQSGESQSHRPASGGSIQSDAVSNNNIDVPTAQVLASIEFVPRFYASFSFCFVSTRESRLHQGNQTTSPQVLLLKLDSLSP